MRSVIFLAGLMCLVLAGCGSYNQVDQGWQGPTSPAESGQHGSGADQRISSEYEIKPIEREYTNGLADPTMEGSGNIAAQGNNGMAARQRNKE